MKKLLIILFCLSAFAAQSQVLQEPNIFGTLYRNLGAKEGQLIPTFCGQPTLSAAIKRYSQATIAYDSCGHKFYLYDPTDSAWKVVIDSVNLNQYINEHSNFTLGNTYVVPSQDSMLHLDTAKIGDVAIIPDSSKSYILQTLPSSSLSSWVLLLFPATVSSFNHRTGAVMPVSDDYDHTMITGLDPLLASKVDQVGANSDSTELWYRKGTDTTVFYNITTGLTGGDTTVFETVIDSTGQPGQRVLWSDNKKIKSDQYFIYDSARHKLVIGNKNISIGGPNTKLYVVGNAIINGTITATSIIKQGGTSSQYLMADGSTTTSAGSGGTTTNAVTFNNSGTGDASGTTFNGSTPRTISYNTIGAVAKADSTTAYVTPTQLAAINNHINLYKPLYGVASDTSIHIYTEIDTTLNDNSDTTLPTTKAVKAYVDNRAGGSGSVTSISQGYGIVNTPNPIVSTGTVTVDSSALSGYYVRRKDSTVSFVTPYQSSLKVSGGSIAWPGTLYSTPTTGSVTSGNLTFSPSLASQSAYTLFGRGSGSGTPSFLTSIDSNWIPSLHSQGYYDLRYIMNNIWSKTGSATYYNSGNVLIGTNTDDGHQLRVNGTIEFNIGSDAPGDIWYRDSLGTFTRLAAPTGFIKPVLGFKNGYPKWQEDSIGTSTTLSTLTDAGTVTWNYTTQGAEAQVTLGGNRTLSITNLPTTVTYFTLTVKQDATGGRTLTLPALTKVINSGAGVVTLSTAANAIDILSFRWDGTTLFCTYGKSYN